MRRHWRSKNLLFKLCFGRTGSLGERLTVCIGAGEATKVAAIAPAYAGHKERHALLRLRGGRQAQSCQRNGSKKRNADRRCHEDPPSIRCT
jgi:hypothetical protein